MECHDTVFEDDHVDGERGEICWTCRVLFKGAEGDEVVGAEEFDFFARFECGDVFCCKGVDTECLRNDVSVVGVGGILATGCAFRRR